MESNRKIDDLGERLLEIKQQTKEDEEKIHNLQGQFTTVMNQIKDETGTVDLDKAKKKLNKMERESESSTKTLIKIIEKLENEYDWD